MRIATYCFALVTLFAVPAVHAENASTQDNCGAASNVYPPLPCRDFGRDTHVDPVSLSDSFAELPHLGLTGEVVWLRHEPSTGMTRTRVRVRNNVARYQAVWVHHKPERNGDIISLNYPGGDEVKLVPERMRLTLCNQIVRYCGHQAIILPPNGETNFELVFDAFGINADEAARLDLPVSAARILDEQAVNPRTIDTNRLNPKPGTFYFSNLR